MPSGAWCEQPRVRRVADDRADRDEVDPREDRRGRRRDRADASASAERQHHEPAREHLVRRRGERVVRHRQARRQRTSRPTTSPPRAGRARRRRASRRPTAAAAPRRRRSRRRRRRASRRAASRRAPRRSSTTQSGTDAMISDASPVGMSRSAKKSTAFAPGSRQPISDARAELRGGRSRSVPPRQSTIAGHDRARGDEPRRDREQRRDRLAGDRDDEVRRAPDDVDGPEGGPHLRLVAHACRAHSSDSAAPAPSRPMPSARGHDDRDLVDAEEAEAVDHRAHHELAGDQDPDRRRRADPRLGERDREHDDAGPSRRRPTSTSARERLAEAARARGGRRAGARARAGAGRPSRT